MRRKYLFLLALGLTLSLAILTVPGSASAHEKRQVGKYTFEVGWAIEPTLVNNANSLFLKVEETQSGQVVKDLEKTLKAEIIVGGGAKKRELPLELSDEEPGVYQSPVIPTRAGDYAFRLFGTINGQTVNETFESGPRTFESVEDVSELQFPDIVSGSESGSGRADTALILAIVSLVASITAAAASGFIFVRMRAR